MSAILREYMLTIDRHVRPCGPILYKTPLAIMQFSLRYEQLHGWQHAHTNTLLICIILKRACSFVLFNVVISTYLLDSYKAGSAPSLIHDLYDSERKYTNHVHCNVVYLNIALYFQTAV